MPKLWNDTIAAHRRQVRDAILDTTAALAAEQGLLAVTMSEIAETTGIGRATLYKYFSGVEEILAAWHERQIGLHLAHLDDVRHEADGPWHQLQAVLRAYARIQRERRDHHGAPHGSELGAFLHRDDQLAPAEARLRVLVRDVLVGAIDAGDVRPDVDPDELTAYCLHALDAAGSLRSEAAADRLVSVVLDGLRAPPA